MLAIGKHGECWHANTSGKRNDPHGVIVHDTDTQRTGRYKQILHVFTNMASGKRKNPQSENEETLLYIDGGA